MTAYSLSADDFTAFFETVHGHPPYPWQRQLAARLVDARGWPEAIDLPTGSGKTACLDAAIFALAAQADRAPADRTAPRRIFFCVNRRVIVDAAVERAKRIAEAVWRAEHEGDTTGILGKVAANLRHIAGTTPGDDAPPLDGVELRGGIVRDNRWARSLTQPVVVGTTVDQLGSRLLFRGYGTSASAAPIEAALVAYDSLILLDEAHISRPFLDTLAGVRQLLDPDRWAAEPIGARPATVVPMTATLPNNVTDVVQLGAADRSPDLPLLKRLTASKPAKLVAHKDTLKALVEAIATAADADEPRAIGVIVNRVQTARDVYAHNGLKTLTRDLVIGSMRPIDRDAQTAQLNAAVGPGRPEQTGETRVVIATQCLEVGADYDFDVLITECASIDALRQRFGRLNRAGREIPGGARGVIVIDKKADEFDPDKLDDDKPADPIYGNALIRTAKWLLNSATDSTVDFGIDAFAPPADTAPLLAPSASAHAPVVLPAYVDLWCQTSPKPVPDPDVPLFLHGPQAGEPDVQVCWRADLTIDDEGDGDADDTTDAGREAWPDIVALLPPTSAECMSIPISRLKRWLAAEAAPTRRGADTTDADVLGTGPAAADSAAEPTDIPPARRGVLWRGLRRSKPADDTAILTRTDQLRPGDTLVLPTSAAGWNDLGHIPETDAPPDRAEGAIRHARGVTIRRLHRSLTDGEPGGTLAELFDAMADTDEPITYDELKALAEKALADDDTIPSIARIVRYPDGRGIVVHAPRVANRRGPQPPHRPLDDGEDESSYNSSSEVALDVHLVDVADAARNALDRLAVSSPLGTAVTIAAELHDLGKADERFQAVLRRETPTDAWLRAGASTAAATLLAKSDGMPQTPRERQATRERAGLPRGWRHEMLSVQLADRHAALADLPPADRDLVLHLIAAHHGRARPFAPVVADPEPPDVEVQDLTLTTEERTAVPAHRLDSGIANRFWAAVRRFGWWGAAYLEATLRLADHTASADEERAEQSQPQEASSAK
jgi:CRISPR-associated endonuclease/helicase Cas3